MAADVQAARPRGEVGRTGHTRPVPGDDDEDDGAVMRARLLSMPAPVLETFLLNRVENLTYAQIAKRMGTFRWIVCWRMLRGIRQVARCPPSFERWLRDI